MASAEKTFEQGVAVGMLLGISNSNKYNYIEDQLLKYILEKGTPIATCQHTTSFSVKFYCGTISYQDPNLNLFTKELNDTYNASFFRYTPNGYLMKDTATQGYGPVALCDNLEVEGFIPYIARILFKGDEALYGDVQVSEASSYKGYINYLYIYDSNDDPHGVKEIVLFYRYRSIPKVDSISYAGDFMLKREHKIQTYNTTVNGNAVTGTRINSSSIKVYTSDGTSGNPYLYAEIPYDRIEYTSTFPKCNWINSEGETVEIDDMTKRPFISKVNTYNNYKASLPGISLSELPNPDMMGNLDISELSSIYLDYEEEMWKEATPPGYTPRVVKSTILPYPEEKEETDETQTDSAT